MPDFKLFCFQFWAKLFPTNDYAPYIQTHPLKDSAPSYWCFWAYPTSSLPLLGCSEKPPRLDYSFYSRLWPQKIHISFVLSSNSSFSNCHSYLQFPKALRGRWQIDWVLDWGPAWPAEARTAWLLLLRSCEVGRLASAICLECEKAGLLHERS